jgi:hypothetical protein
MQAQRLAFAIRRSLHSFGLFGLIDKESLVIFYMVGPNRPVVFVALPAKLLANLVVIS